MIKHITLKNKLDSSRTYLEHWKKLTLFCPCCGVHEVWNETGEGDYYVGSQYLCLSCKAKFYLPSGVNLASGEQNKQRIEQLLKP